MNHRPSQIEARLGRAAAERLAEAYGGTRLYVPGDPRDGKRLIEALGEELAVAVIFHFGISRIYVPRLGGPKRIDPRKVKRMAAKGLSSARIARALGCSERTVDAHRAKLAKDAG